MQRQTSLVQASLNSGAEQFLDPGGPAEMTPVAQASSSTRRHDSLPRAVYDLPAGGDTTFINRQVHYGSGQFCGRVVRIEIHELQRAELGRKYARVDRRPLDPPPVVQMRIYEVLDEIEREIPNYDSIEVHGFIGMVDLFPIPSLEKERRKTPKQSQHPSSPNVGGSGTGPVPPPQYQPSSTDEPHTLAAPSCQSGHNSNPEATRQSGDHEESPDVVHNVDGKPIRESSKMTHALVGATFVEPVAVDWQGQKSLMFVFADLAVKTEGYFMLRYRVFNIFSTPIGNPDRIIQAECYGGVFRVYSTKEFPGLQASTELTKQLARWGVRLNIREAERKRRRKGDSRSQSPAAATEQPPLPSVGTEEKGDKSPSAHGEDHMGEKAQPELQHGGDDHATNP